MKLVDMMMNVMRLTSIKYSWSKYFPSLKNIIIKQYQYLLYQLLNKNYLFMVG